MGFMKSCGKKILIQINILFGLVGLVCFVGGLVVKYGSDKIKPILSDLMDELEKKVAPLSKEIGISTEEFTDKLDLETLLGDAAVVFIVLGAIILLVVFCGCCGACLKSKCLLILSYIEQSDGHEQTYIIVLVLVLLGQVFLVVVILEKREIIDEKIKQPMRESLKELYHGDDGLDAISLAWNAVMLKLACCGVDNVNDLSGGKWNRRPKTSTFTLPQDLDSPFVCCKESKRSDIKNYWQCAKKPFDSSWSNYDKGCYDAMWDYLDQHKDIVIGIAVGLACLEILLIFFSIYIVKDMNKDSKVSPDHS